MKRGILEDLQQILVERVLQECILLQEPHQKKIISNGWNLRKNHSNTLEYEEYAKLAAPSQNNRAGNLSIER